jgi:Gpi18-like mannosyltransferase
LTGAHLNSCLVETASESLEPLTEPLEDQPPNGRAPARSRTAWLPTGRELPRRDWRLNAAGALRSARFAILVYLGSRALLIVVALLDSALRHQPLTNELANWDGGWYRAVVTDGYPTHAFHTQTALGFFPLYPMVVWVVSQPLVWFTTQNEVWAAIIAGVVVSGIGGLIATVLVQRLATGWWGEQSGRRAVALFCLFPGSVVFSMVYAEGILIPLAAGCILALQRRRWLLAGVLAALATATEPEAIVLILVCAVSAIRELRRRGWSDPVARRSLIAPVLAPAGLVAFAAFLWAWTGTPFASSIAQHYGWNERSDPLALVHLTTRLAGEISFTHFDHPTINLNLVVGLVGALFLLVVLVLLVKARRTVSIEALIWTFGIALLAVTSEYTPPNPRLLITAFPAVIVLAYYLRRRGFTLWLVANGVLLAGLSALTFVSVTLRP